MKKILLLVALLSAVKIAASAPAESRAKSAKPEFIRLLETSQSVEKAWSYTNEAPAADWVKRAFDDSAWQVGEGMFGSKNTPGVRVGTEWTSNDIYLRRSFELKTVPSDVRLRVFHDDEADIYINGQLVKSLQGFTADYITVKMDNADGVLIAGSNTIAAHCHQTVGGEGVDVGLVMVEHADFQLSQLFDDNMVIQRDTQAPVWGWADAGETVTVKASWGAQALATADAKGKWLLRIQTPPATIKPQTLSISGNGKPNASILLNNVIAGDVWLASGQSNMEFRQREALNPDTEARDYPFIRTFNLLHSATDIPQERIPLQQSWIGCSPQDSHHFSAAALFFARRIYNETSIPIGIISCSWGGMPIERFIPAAGFARVPELKEISDQIQILDPTTPAGRKEFTRRFQQFEKWLPAAKAAVAANEYPLPAPELPTMLGAWQSREATRIYNGMIHSLIPYAVKGAIWYQGEANAGHDTALYPAKKEALIESWRELFESGEFPFYFVQLAGFQVSQNKPEGGDGFAPMREAQRQSLTIPHTGMALAIDIGNPHDIHPKNKPDVGKRLAQLALHYDYGKEIVPCGPLYRSMEIKGDRIVVHFDHAGSGLMAAVKTGLDAPQSQVPQQLEHFAIAGADKVWHWAKASIQGDTVVVSSPGVRQPVAVRFAYTSTAAKFNFYNKEVLPASPFRTDDW